MCSSVNEVYSLTFLNLTSRELEPEDTLSQKITCAIEEYEALFCTEAQKLKRDLSCIEPFAEKSI